jgi:hypothetical protein
MDTCRRAYQPDDFVKQLLTLERPGAATVVADQPQRTYYVAVLLARDEPSVKQFREVYSRTPRLDPLYSIFARQRSEEYRRMVMDSMRREASGGKVKDGRWDIPEDIRKRDARGDSEAE